VIQIKNPSVNFETARTAREVKSRINIITQNKEGSNKKALKLDRFMLT